MKRIVYLAQCECGWRSEPQASQAKVSKQVKNHLNDVLHKDYDDVPLWDGQIGTGTGEATCDL